MAHRKQLPQPRPCAQCGTTFHTARKGHVHCSSACNTRAWRRRQPAASQALTLGHPVAETGAATVAEPSSVTLAFNGTNVGTAIGNLLSEGVKKLFAPTARTLNLATPSFPPGPRPSCWPPSRRSGWPTRRGRASSGCCPPFTTGIRCTSMPWPACPTCCGRSLIASCACSRPLPSYSSWRRAGRLVRRCGRYSSSTGWP